MQSLKSYKPLLITVAAVLIVLVLIPAIGIMATEGYLKKTMYSEVNLIVYEQAQDTLSKAPLAFLSEPLLALDNALFPDKFMHASDFSPEALANFDPTVHPALFQVLGVNLNDNTLALKFMTPAWAEGETMNASLNCTADQTKVYEASGNVTPTMKNGLLDASSVAKNTKTYNAPKAPFDFIAGLFSQDAVKKGTKTIQLSGLCADANSCSPIRQCSIMILGK